MRHPGTTIIILLFTLSGCAVGPDFVAPPVPALPSQFVAEHAPRSGALLGQWWQLFADPTLVELLAAAEGQNLTVHEAFERIVEARARVSVETGRFYPEGAAFGAYSYTKRSANAQPFVGPNGSPFDLFNYGVDTLWELDLFGRLKRGIESAQAELFADEESFADLRLTLLADVASNYVQLRVFQQQLRIARENLALQDEVLKQIEERFAAGKVSRLDVAQASSTRLLTSARIPEIEKSLQLAFNRLSVLIGIPPNRHIEEMVGEGSIPVAASLTGVGFPAELIRRRPDIRAAEHQVAAAGAKIGVATADLYPQFSILGTISLQSRNFSSLFSPASLAAAVGPSLQWNILHYFRIRANIATFESEYRQSVIAYQNKILVAVEEVEDGLTRYQFESQRRGFLAAAVEQDELAVKLSRERYEAGNASFQRVVSTLQQLLNDQLELASIKGNLSNQLIRTYKAVGGGWQPVQVLAYMAESPPSNSQSCSFRRAPSPQNEMRAVSVDTEPIEQADKPELEPPSTRPAESLPQISNPNFTPTRDRLPMATPKSTNSIQPKKFDLQQMSIIKLSAEPASAARNRSSFTPNVTHHVAIEPVATRSPVIIQDCADVIHNEFARLPPPSTGARRPLVADERECTSADK